MVKRCQVTWGADMHMTRFRARRVAGFMLVVLTLVAAIGLRLGAQSTSPQLALVEDSGYLPGDDLGAKLSSLGVQVVETYGFCALGVRPSNCANKDLA